MMMGKDAYDRSWKHAQKLIKAERGADIMPAQLTQNQFEAPCTADRWYSLTSPLHDGADDFFSSDTPDEKLDETFGKVTPAETPLLILYSGADEFTPKAVDKHALVGRWFRACEKGGVNVDRVNSGVVDKATHNLEGSVEGKREALIRVERFLGWVGAGEGNASGGGSSSLMNGVGGKL